MEKKGSPSGGVFYVIFSCKHTGPVSSSSRQQQGAAAAAGSSREQQQQQQQQREQQQQQQREQQQQHHHITSTPHPPDAGDLLHHLGGGVQVDQALCRRGGGGGQGRDVGTLAKDRGWGHGGACACSSRCRGLDIRLLHAAQWRRQQAGADAAWRHDWSAGRRRASLAARTPPPRWCLRPSTCSAGPPRPPQAAHHGTP